MGGFDMIILIFNSGFAEGRCSMYKRVFTDITFMPSAWRVPWGHLVIGSSDCSSVCFSAIQSHLHANCNIFIPARCGGDIVTLLWSVRQCVLPSMRRPCEHDRDYTVPYFFVKLGRHVNHDERTNPIDFGVQRSKVKVTMDIYGNKLVNTIEA